ncbi:MAG: CBS domain-containing protein [Thermodesulfobacteriota bacterium]
MDVISTHLNADFDAFASMVAAKKLYPGAVLAFPGSQEKNLRDFFIESTMYILSIERARDIDLDKVQRLILVDTRQKTRIGRFAEVVDKGTAEIHIFDHHPASPDDIAGDLEIIDQVGATVTILVREIKKRGIELNTEEATALALGIYEDTGSFKYSSTTAEDLDAASWLLEMGANLNVVSDMMNTELSVVQIQVLHQLIEESETILVGGVEVVVTTAATQEYVGDLAVLVHKLKEMENLDAVFALVRMEDRVHLIARSRLDEVSAGEIAAEFGGGGHPTAASATIKEMSLYQAKEELVAALRDKVRPKQTAAEIMSRPVYRVEPYQALHEAASLLSRYEVSSLPVVQNGTVVGIVHRAAVEKACHHGLEQETVRSFMDPRVLSVDVTDPIEKAMRISVEGRVRLVPVMEGEQLVGVISRSDLLEHLRLPRHNDASSPEDFPEIRNRSKNVRKLMDERIPPALLDILRKAGEAARDQDEAVYLVGGAVRDLLLRRENFDMDLVVEGNGIRFAKELCRQFPRCRIRSHEKFGTAVLLFEDGFKLDVATARHEYYESPGALPSVEVSSLKRDLYRRDFTINTLAIRLNPDGFGAVSDFFGGARDIKEKNIRVLHNLAFVEDPTRILRAIRFSARFGFSLGKHTRNLMRAAIKMKLFDRVEGRRLLHELILIFEERNPAQHIAMMEDYSIPQALHPALSFGPKVQENLESLSGVLSWWRYLYLKDRLRKWVVYFLAVTDGLSDHDYRGVLTRFSVATTVSEELAADRIGVRRSLAAFAKGEFTRTSEMVESLRVLSTEALLCMMAGTRREDARRSIADYITTLRFVKPLLTGNDLIAMGLKPGPLFHRILKTLRDARLDQRILTVEDERNMVELLCTADSEEHPHPATQTSAT